MYVGHTDNGSEIKLSVYDEDEYSNYQNELSISAFDGVKINGSDVITKDTVDESGILTTNEDGVVNKSELTIGSFEIKDDKPYNYTLEGHYEPYDWSRYTDESVMDCIFTAEYNHAGAKLYSDRNDDDYWAYEFVVTDAEIYVSYENEGVEDYKWIPCNRLGDNVLPIPVDILDNLVFTDGVADVEENISIYVDGVDDYIYDAKIIETAPFSLKHPSKALLNGSPVITVETLEKSDIVSNLNNRISQVDTKINDLSETITEEFMPATLSGDPMHKMYEAVGAVWNANTGYWNFYDMTDITNEEMRSSVLRGYISSAESEPLIGSSRGTVSMIRFNLPRLGGSNVTWNMASFARYNSKLEVLNLTNYKGVKTAFKDMLNYAGDLTNAFNGCTKLRKVYGIVYCNSVSNTTDAFTGCVSLDEIWISKLKTSISFADSPLSVESATYLLQNANSTAQFTVTFRADRQAIYEADADFMTAKKSNITIMYK